MENLLVFVFWISVGLVGYTYVGYGIIIFVFSRIKRRPRPPESLPDAALPVVTIVIAAYNEEEFIEEKITNTLRLNYPKDKLVIFIVTDGSTDRTGEIVDRFPQIKHFHEAARKGKIHAVNRIMKLVSTPITVFCDANTYLNADSIRNMVRHYQDSSVGGVAGEKRIVRREKDDAAGSGEGLYWKYESFLKRKDAEVYTVAGAAGELFSIRTSLYEPPDEDTIIEDFYMSMRMAGKGYRFAYEDGAFATESASVSVEEEWKRKVRICAGAFQAMGRLAYLLNPFRYGILTFQYVSHRVMRWTVAPLALLLMLISNVILAYDGPAFFKFFILCQAAFYMLAVAGYVMRDKTVSIKGFFVPYYFVVMNTSVYAGFLRYMRGAQSVVWERSERAGNPYP
jgi:cellulose synthase/poly-beta-1,6-N-acetylglucosamine synthase-like glycosyltransferase